MNLQARRLRKEDFRHLSKRSRSTAALLRRLERKPDMRSLEKAAQHRVIKGLVEHAGSPSAKRVERYLELFNEAFDLDASFRAFFVDRDTMYEFLHESSNVHYVGTRIPNTTGIEIDFPQFPQLQEVNQRLNEVLRELWTITRKYDWHPFIRHAGFGDGFWVETYFKAQGAAEEWENWAMIWLTARNAQWNERFRRCQRCSKWLFAVVEHQQYCGEKCRKSAASTSESFKERRRTYMREYRRQENERSARAKRVARSGDGKQR